MNALELDRSALIDIRSVNINEALPISEKIADYIRQIKNPYLYKCGKIVVNISFADTNETLEDRLESYLSTL